MYNNWFRYFKLMLEMGIDFLIRVGYNQVIIISQGDLKQTYIKYISYIYCQMECKTP